MAKQIVRRAPTSKPPGTETIRPVFTTRHRALKAAVWKNTSAENGDFYKVTLTRSYKKGEEWKESCSFGYDDILIVAELLRTCHGYISRELAKQSEISKT